jgi:hypothetical protein
VTPIEDVAVGEDFQARGAHVAWGDAADADLIERAAQNARTIVIVTDSRSRTDELLRAAVDGGRAAGVDRIVFCGTHRAGWVVETLEGEAVEYVALWAGKRRLLRGPELPVEAVAAVIDAADDIAGDVRLDLDLTDAAAWAKLKLAPPGTQTPR